MLDAAQLPGGRRLHHLQRTTRGRGRTVGRCDVVADSAAPPVGDRSDVFRSVACVPHGPCFAIGSVTGMHSTSITPRRATTDRPQAARSRRREPDVGRPDTARQRCLPMSSPGPQCSDPSPQRRSRADTPVAPSVSSHETDFVRCQESMRRSARIAAAAGGSVPAAERGEALRLGFATRRKSPCLVGSSGANSS